MPKFEVESDVELELWEPQMYKVLLHNDDYTSMDFVVEVLTSIFHKTQEQAVQIMLQIHEKGKAICGVYTALRSPRPKRNRSNSLRRRTNSRSWPP